MSHSCHAEGCRTPVPARMFACKRHWYMVPLWLRDLLWDAYREGQENDKQPSTWYMLVQTRCRLEIARQEGRAGPVTREMSQRLRNALHPESPEQAWDDARLIQQFDLGCALDTLRHAARTALVETWESVGEHPPSIYDGLSEEDVFGGELPGDRG